MSFKLFLLALFFSPSLFAEKPVKKSYLPAQAQQAAKTIRLPAEIITELETFYLSEFKRLSPEQAALMKDSEILVKMKRKGLKSNVRFEPIDSPVLAGNYRFDMPIGGGEILMSDYVRSQYPGRFKVFFDVGPVGGMAAKEAFNGSVKVLYLSKGLKRQVKGIQLGSGCNVYYDISKKYRELLSKEGLTVDVMDASHVSTLGGYFIFAFVFEEHLNLSVLKFSDNQYSHFLCS